MIHLITGKQGSGKTLLMTKMSYEGYLKGKTVYSNVDFKFPYKTLDYQDIISCKLENAIVVIDEGHLLLSSRNSMSTTSRKICDSFVSMVRKKNLDLIISTQAQRKIDCRIRDETDYYHNAEKYVYINNEWIIQYSNIDLDIDIPTIILINTTDMSTDQQIKSFFHANIYYKLYDTKQIIEIKNI